MDLGGVIGVFLAIDMFLFFFFWEMMLVPMYFLIALWGHKASDGKTRITAATKFFIYTRASGLVMLIAIHGHGVRALQRDRRVDLRLRRPAANADVPQRAISVDAGLLHRLRGENASGAAARWLPDAHSPGTDRRFRRLAGILLKTAAYGLLRFSLPLFPEASHEFAPIAMWLGVIGIFYGARMAFAQTDIKRLIAYTSVSHMGFVLIAIYTGSQLAYQAR